MKLLLIEPDLRRGSACKKVLARAGFDVDVAAIGSNIDPAGYFLVMVGKQVSPADRANIASNLLQRPRGASLLWMANATSTERRSARHHLVEAFRIEAVVSRLQTLLERANARVLRVGNITLNRVSGEVFIADKRLFLPPAELVVFTMLIQDEGRVVLKKMIESRLFGVTNQAAANAAEVRIYRLRRRLAAADASAQIRTVRNVGYFLAC